MEKPNLDKFFGIPGILNAALLLEQLEQEVFSIAEVEVSHSTIKKLEKEGLLFKPEPAHRTKANYSITEFVWLKMISELRSIGTPLKRIKLLKDGLCSPIPQKLLYRYFDNNRQQLRNLPQDDSVKGQIIAAIDSDSYEEKEDAYFSILHFLIGETILTGKPVSVKLFKDGYWLPWSDTGAYGQYFGEEEQRRMAFEAHTTVSISNIVKAFLATDKFATVIPKFTVLNKDELKILEVIGSGDYKSVTINFRNRKIKSLELIKKQDVKRRLVDILSDNAYQDIVIKSHNGIVTQIQNTIKMTFD